MLIVWLADAIASREDTATAQPRSHARVISPVVRGGGGAP